MNTQILSYSEMKKMEEVKKMKSSVERVATWTLTFTNAYFLSILISRLL